MITILFIIHQWFFSTPNKNKKYTSRLHPSSQSNRKKKNFQIEASSGGGSISGETAPKEYNCQPDFCTHIALPTVCKLSATLIVAGIQTPAKPLRSLKMSIEEKFRAAVRVIHSLPKDGPYQPSNSTKLKFYGLYKQATEGKNNTPKPSFWDLVNKAKWDAWTKHDDMSQEEAMNRYVDGLKEIVETMSFNGDVEDFLDSIGPFYEFVTLQGNDMKNIKEKIEEFSSSNSSLANSLANSRSNSLANSKESSPVKMLENGDNEEEGDEEEEEEISTSEKAEVIIETSSATYESKAHHKKNHAGQNGQAFKMTNGDDHRHNHSLNNVPPPAPRHSYSNQNGFVNHALPNENDEDEVLTVSTSYNVACKEDLERDVEDGNNDHQKVKLTSSIDTVASNATSGTESEKYYSGDSDPEMEEKFAKSLSLGNNGCYPTTSKAAFTQQQQQQQQPIHVQQSLHAANDGSHNFKKSMSNSSKKSFKGYVSPKSSSALMNAADAATQQTIERLNRDVDHILARLRILEAAYAANAEGVTRAPSNQNESGRRKRRMFGDLSPQSIAFIVMWPFAVQFLIKLIRWWWRRRRNVRAITN